VLYAYSIDLSLSTARPLTPSLCPPAEFASGKTVTSQRNMYRPSSNLAHHTITYPLPCLTSHELPRNLD